MPSDANSADGHITAAKMYYPWHARSRVTALIGVTGRPQGPVILFRPAAGNPEIAPLKSGFTRTVAVMATTVQNLGILESDTLEFRQRDFASWRPNTSPRRTLGQKKAAQRNVISADI